jgi:hypothetical protein
LSWKSKYRVVRNLLEKAHRFFRRIELNAANYCARRKKSRVVPCNLLVHDKRSEVRPEGSWMISISTVELELRIYFERCAPRIAGGHEYSIHRLRRCKKGRANSGK